MIKESFNDTLIIQPINSLRCRVIRGFVIHQSIVFEATINTANV